jgi:hypothetical protein
MMGLQRFERRLERLVEGTFGKAFRSELQPVEIGRRIVREMDNGRTLGVRGTVAPNQFVVSLSHDDIEQFAGFQDALVRELVDAAREHAREDGYHFEGPVEVVLEPDDHARKGDLKVRAAIVEGDTSTAAALTLPDGRRVALGDETTVIGRMPDCAITLTDSQVSRHHAEVRRAERGFTLVDLDSMNGTYVNGVRVREHPLADGDVIAVGATSIRYEES